MDCASQQMAGIPIRSQCQYGVYDPNECNERLIANYLQQLEKKKHTSPAGRAKVQTYPLAPHCAKGWSKYCNHRQSDMSKYSSNSKADLPALDQRRLSFYHIGALGWISPLVLIHQYALQRLWNRKIAAQILSHALACCLVPTHLASFIRDLANLHFG